jgi:hypothetical protein
MDSPPKVTGTMINFEHIIKLADNFHKDSRWEFRLTKFARDTQELLNQAEDYDIKDEELYNQFESFINAYRDLIGTLGIDASNLNTDAFEDAAQLIDTLKKRYDRIINNSYLNASEDEGYEEEFDPGELTKFLSEVAQDAENKLKEAAGEDVDISEMRAAQYAQEFNDNRNIDRGDQNITWTGDKVRQNLEARRRWFQDLMVRKKLNINDPRYQNYIETRRRNWADMMADPVRKAAYRVKANKRQDLYSKRVDLRVKEIEKVLPQLTDVRKKEELQKELTVLRTIQDRRKNQSKERAKKVREIKQSGTLTGLIVHLQQKLASFKKDAATSLKKKAAKDPYFNNFKRAVQNAKENFDRSPTPENQAALNNANQQEADALNKYLNDNPIINKIREDLPILYAYRDKMKTVDDQNWLGETVPEEVKPFLYQLIVEGEKLIANYSTFYRTPTETIREMVQLMKSKL